MQKVDPTCEHDPTPCPVASYLGLRCLSITLLEVSRPNWIFTQYFSDFLDKRYVVGTHLNCLDLSDQTNYADMHNLHVYMQIVSLYRK